MKIAQFARLLPLAGILLLGTAGCDDGYSESVVYELRKDPIAVENNSLGGYYNEPDPPGQLPLLTIANLDDPRNPFHEKHKEKSVLDRGAYIDPTLASQDDRDKIDALLTRMFGTPAHPRVAKPDGVSDEDFKYFGFATETLEKGGKLYRIHCLHCHGVSGDGRGPTARWVNPHPRDYRQGRFKFTSVDQVKGKMPPHRDDLLRTLAVGIEGTAMPSFIVLPEEEREAIISYVMHLSLRGRVEYDMFTRVFKYENGKLVDKKELTFEGNVTIFHKLNVKSWLEARNKLIVPSKYPYDPDDVLALAKSVERGKQIFMDPPKKFNIGDSCYNANCHADFGRQSKFREDDWGTFAKPNNFYLGVFRGGRRPVDIYYRVHSGIPASGMPAFGNLLQQTLAEPGTDPIWDVVNFVQAMGTPAMRKNLKIYD